MSTSRASSDIAYALTLPYSGPKNVPIVDVHHNPLAIKRIFVDRASVNADKFILSSELEDDETDATHIYPRRSFEVI